MLNSLDFMNRHKMFTNCWYGTHECLNQTKTNYTLGNSFKLYTECNEIPNTIHKQRIINIVGRSLSIICEEKLVVYAYLIVYIVYAGRFYSSFESWFTHG